MVRNTRERGEMTVGKISNSDQLLKIENIEILNKEKIIIKISNLIKRSGMKNFSSIY